MRVMETLDDAHYFHGILTFPECRLITDLWFSSVTRWNYLDRNNTETRKGTFSGERLSTSCPFTDDNFCFTEYFDDKSHLKPDLKVEYGAYHYLWSDFQNFHWWFHVEYSGGSWGWRTSLILLTFTSINVILMGIRTTNVDTHRVWRLHSLTLSTLWWTPLSVSWSNPWWHSFRGGSDTLLLCFFCWTGPSYCTIWSLVLCLLQLLQISNVFAISRFSWLREVSCSVR